jgi:hypothetical protein
METHGLKKFSSKQLGLEGNTEVLIPNSINRLRQQGSGSRYVHGGASLQEVVVPLVEVGKTRKSDISKVEVEILAGGRSIISSSQLSVIFYQKDAVTGKTAPRTLHAAIYSSSDELISNEHEIDFDLTEDNARERNQKTVSAHQTCGCFRRAAGFPGSERTPGKNILLRESCPAPLQSTPWYGHGFRSLRNELCLHLIKR